MLNLSISIFFMDGFLGFAYVIIQMFTCLNKLEERSMDFMKVMKERHSVRSYKGQAIDGDVKKELLSLIWES